MSFKTLASSLLLASVIKAQIYTPPIPCLSFLSSFESCGGTSVDADSPIADLRSVNDCFCNDPGFSAVVNSCLSQLDTTQPGAQSSANGIAAAQQFCATMEKILENAGNGGGGGGSEVTTAPPSIETGPGAAECSAIDSLLSSCGVTEEPLLTVASNVKCACNGGLPNYVDGCFGYLSTANPAAVTALGILQDTDKYCGAGGAGSGGSAPSPTQGGSNAGTTKGGSNANGGPTETSSNPGETTKPNSGNSLKPLESIFLVVLGVLVMVL